MGSSYSRLTKNGKKSLFFTYNFTTSYIAHTDLVILVSHIILRKFYLLLKAI